LNIWIKLHFVFCPNWFLINAMHLDLLCCQSIFLFYCKCSLSLLHFVYSLLFVNCIFEMPQRSQSFSHTRASITNSPRCTFDLLVPQFPPQSPQSQSQATPTHPCIDPMLTRSYIGLLVQLVRSFLKRIDSF